MKKHPNPNQVTKNLHPARGFLKATFYFFTLVLLLASSVFNKANASHYRYGNISWTRGAGNTITLKTAQSYRRSYFGAPVVGSTVSESNIVWGDGTSQLMVLTVTAVNITEDWFFCEATITHTYATAGTYEAYYATCCRLSTLLNNSNQNFRSFSIVQAGGTNDSPISNSTPIVNVQTGLAAATFQVAGADPNGDAITYRFATAAEMGGGAITQPSGMTVSTTGLVTFNTVGKTAGQLYNAAFVVTDVHGATTMIDVMVRIVQQSSAPVFDYAVTPVNNFVYDVQPGTNVSFNVRATDIDAGDIVTLSAAGLPPAATVTPALPLNGNPVQTAFSWTPTAANLGSRIVTFVAQDAAGVQTTTNVTIIVGYNPVFNTPPTLALNSETCIMPAVAYNTTIEASSPDPMATVRITSATTLAGISYSPVIPTTAGNTTSTSLSWTPTVSQWGPHTMNYVATDNTSHTKNHSFVLVVNSKPLFTSTPVITATVGQLYTYNITVSDPDIAFGDVMAISAITIPSWLTLTHTPNSLTATLSGTPTVADLGTASVQLHAEDFYHHCYGHTEQDIEITVVPAVTTCGPVTTRIYVDASAAAGGTGSSWACAINQLSSAITMANANMAIKSIWVADGTYTPGAARTDVMAITRADLMILGGFAGGEANAVDANPAVNLSIISGDIGVVGNMSDNSYRLMNIGGSPVSANALVVDGFVFEKGNANGAGDKAIGAAILSNGIPVATPIWIKRSLFRNNNAVSSGGAVYLTGANLAFDGCRFVSNTAGTAGGAVFTYQASPTFNNTVFVGNTAPSGGGYYGNFGYHKFNKTVFTGNSATYGGGVYQNRMGADYFNCVFNANTSTQGGAIYEQNTSTSHILNSTFFKNTGVSYGGAIVLTGSNSSTVTENSIFWKNTHGGSATSPWADFVNYTGGANVYANNILQLNTAVPADNGTTRRFNKRGVDPLFVNEASPVGADVMWGTADDGLQLQDCATPPAANSSVAIIPTGCSPAINAGDNAPVGAAGLTTDERNNPRIVCSVVDMGAYENQNCGVSITSAEQQVMIAAQIMSSPKGATGIVANPISNDLQIRYAGTERASVVVFAESGKMIWSKNNIAEGITHADASGWARGIYQVVILTTNGKRMNFKVVRL